MSQKHSVPNLDPLFENTIAVSQAGERRMKDRFVKVSEKSQTEKLYMGMDLPTVSPRSEKWSLLWLLLPLVIALVAAFGAVSAPSRLRG